MESHLKNDLLPFWMKLRDPRGGYAGRVTFDGTVMWDADKGTILHSRILWFFSNAAMLFGDKELLAYAAHAYQWLRDCCFDPIRGGIYWSLTPNGDPLDDTKHIYNMAFGIYALSSYYLAGGEKEALTLAMSLFNTVEAKCRLGDGYGESYRVDFTPEENRKLSGNGVIAQRTMNSLLHLYEGYTELYRAGHDPRVGNALRKMAELILRRVFNPEKCRLEVFFDRNWQSLVNVHSYGHDVEAAWLLERGTEILGDPGLAERMGVMCRVLADSVYEGAYVGDCLLLERENDRDKTDRVWWVQAEAVVGFYHAYRKTGDERFREATQKIWEYIKTYLLDRPHGGEWIGYLGETGISRGRADLVGPWKCPYHNGRMCMEMIRRTREM